MPGQLDEIIDMLERRRQVIEEALSALRNVDGPEWPANDTASLEAIVSPVGGVPGRNQSKTAPSSRSKHAAARTGAVGQGDRNRDEVPAAKAKHAAKLTEGTMKARTVDLLRKAGRPMRSGEVAKRMKIGAGYASVNLSQLRRDGFLVHTADGYVVR